MYEKNACLRCSWINLVAPNMFLSSEEVMNLQRSFIGWIILNHASISGYNLNMLMHGFLRVNWVRFYLLKTNPLQQETSRMMEHHPRETLEMWHLNFILALYPWNIMHSKKIMYFPRDQVSLNASFIWRLGTANLVQFASFTILKKDSSLFRTVSWVQLDFLYGR